ncbi:Pantoate--beta-alanine ligase [Nakaseomyces bracarensis]|uniref:Pantoate--beta-alanine ligase n=1 Tax=Nakaseomyces bracarensis TaxID=273131 RepID=A0ABR4NMW9_9SACH
MKVFHTVKELVQWRTNDIGDRRNVNVGFVPTMGALHAGHASLIAQSVKDNDYTVASIFVNPSQFAPGEDLDQYPRTLPEDIKLLESFKCDVLFAPNASEMYPQGIPLDVHEQKGPFVSVLGVSEMLEGKTRPNFFRGVATVVTKLLNIVSPDVAYFGQKDIQQFIVLETMVKELFVNTRLVRMPIARAESGLALSSRNKYLCPESIEISATLYKGISKAAQLIKSGTTARNELINNINAVWQPCIDSGDFKVDYISIADYGTLHELETVHCSGTADEIVISCAIYVTDRQTKTVVRLIDNIVM